MVEKKKRFNSKGKGNGFEGIVAKKLSTALSPLKFIRTPGSGARVGGKNFQTLGHLFGADALKLFVGDVVPVNEKEHSRKFQYSVECKSYANSDSFETIVAGNANIFKWMRESIDDAQKTNLKPILVFKWNRTPIYLACISGEIPAAPKLTLSQNTLSIDVFYFEELLSDQSLWVKEIS